MQPKTTENLRPRVIPLHGLSVVRTTVILAIALGYASTMAIGTEGAEFGKHWGYDPSWFGLQVLFVLSGFLALRSLADGRSAREFLFGRARSVWVPLIMVTGWIVVVLYPLLSAPTLQEISALPKLSSYFLKTVLLIEPGARLPGLMDEAKYAGLIQGAIWTLRWGLLAHIGLWIMWQIRAMRGGHAFAILALGLMGTYIGTVFWAVQIDNPPAKVVAVIPGMRLGCAYLAGATLYFWQHKLPVRASRKALTLALLAIVTTALYKTLPWTPMIEIFGAGFWGYFCIIVLQHAPRKWATFPRLEPALYVSIWPLAQIVVQTAPGLSQLAIITASLAFALITAGIVWAFSQVLRRSYRLSRQVPV